jgi:hypothetical protein
MFFMLQVSITVVLSGIEISGLAIGPKVRGRVRWIFKSDEVRSTSSFGGKVKTS